MVSIFIVPIIMIILPLMQSLGVTGSDQGVGALVFEGIIFLLPAAFSAMLLGQVMIGEEGQSVGEFTPHRSPRRASLKARHFS